MCGIAGIIHLKNETPPISILERMNSAIVHRGPDDSGYYQNVGVGLCHRRLSIIDLTANAHQPMSNEDGSMWLTYNGEIYNYLELASQLASAGHIFNSHSDSEVILHSFEDSGANCLQTFNGMFAFALWNAKRKELFAARDRIGIKPFYYYFDGIQFIFASEIKAILANPHVTVEPDIESIYEYLVYGNSYTDRTWYKGIRQLLPGHYLTVGRSGLTIKQYWDVSFQPDYSRSFDSFAEELRSLLKDAVRLHLRSDVPVGSHLSGGIDSSSIVSLATDCLHKKIHTFSGAFKEGADYDERSFINIVSSKMATIHREVVPKGIELAEVLPKLLWFLDEPVAGPGSFPQYKVSQLIAQSGIKVVTGGQGGDELFGGYPPYNALAAKNILNHVKRCDTHVPLSELMHLPYYVHKAGAHKKIASLFFPQQARLSCITIDKKDKEALDNKLNDALSKVVDLDPFERQTYSHIKFYLPTLLHVEDRTSMAWSIESRVPLLDYRVVELSTKMPSWVKVRRGELKYVLREAMRGITPDEILDRRDKKGFPTPIGVWFAGELHQWLREQLLHQPLLCNGIVDRSILVQMIDAQSSGRSDCAHELWKVLNLELWMRGVSKGWSNVV